MIIVRFKNFQERQISHLRKLQLIPKKIGYSLIETYEVECEDGIVNIKGSAVAGPEWTDFGIGYIIAY